MFPDPLTTFSSFLQIQLWKSTKRIVYSDLMKSIMSDPLNGVQHFLNTVKTASDVSDTNQDQSAKRINISGLELTQFELTLLTTELTKF